jgi:protein ImuB
MPAPRRILSLWLPRFASDIALRRRPAEGPFAIIARQASADRLVCLNGAALGAGLSVGMGLADARALCPDLVTRAHDPMGQAQALTALHRWALRYAPWGAADGLDGLVLDITGAAHLLGGEGALLADLSARLARMGLAARMAIAGTRGAACAVARYGKGGIVPTGAEAQALGPLPLAALRLPPDTVEGLDRLGLRIIRDLAQIPRATLPRRFGPDVLLRLDQALGQMGEPVSATPLPPHFGVRLSLPDPVGLLGDLQAGLARLLDRLCDHLHRAEMGARRLHLTLSRVDGQAVQVEITLARPMRDPAAIALLFDRALDGVDAGFGIDGLRLTAPVTEKLALQQITAQGSAAQDDLADLLTRLCNRVGFDNVQRLLPADSHIPEKAFVTAAAAYCEAGGPWPGSSPRPIEIFDPEPIYTPAHRRPPPRFRWRGQDWQVIATSGPERISPEWWLDDPAWRAGLRDYWRVQTAQGARLWLFHTPQQDGWSVQGALG